MRQSRILNLVAPLLRRTAPLLFTGLVLHSSLVVAQQEDVFESEEKPAASAAELKQEETGRWELTDEDRMTEEELNRELFGDRDSDDADRSDPDDEQANEDPVSDRIGEDENAVEDDEEPAPSLTIESYLQPIGSVTLDVAPPVSPGRDGFVVPQRIQPPPGFSSVRNAIPAPIVFQTPDIRYQPLYYEDASAERWGQDAGRRQPLYSAGRFVGAVIRAPRDLRSLPPRAEIYRANPRYSGPTLLGR